MKTSLSLREMLYEVPTPPVVAHRELFVRWTLFSVDRVLGQ